MEKLINKTTDRDTLMGLALRAEALALTNNVTLAGYGYFSRLAARARAKANG
jgi:hypothetical protein